MRIPVIRGTIDRRVLINYQADPESLAKILPPPFRPKTVNGLGIVGICLIRLKNIRPRFIPLNLGVGSENAAHRIAVEWEEQGKLREGVYIPRRDTSSRLNRLVGGKLFPGLHHPAHFEVREQDSRYQIAFDSEDGNVHVLIKGHVVSTLPSTSVFRSLAEASKFFEGGSLGYSVTRTPGEYDGLELRSLTWKVEPLAVDQIESSFFVDKNLFPEGSLQFDCALLMRNIQHEWYSRASLCYSVAA
jgi:hypothetical protein